ncbi:hypothetical protein L6R29_09480 [Myxococcota bacterium]|nr:hypothetical protein [Myxococcota bacterium]
MQSRSLASKRRWFHVAVGLVPEVLVTGFQRADFGGPVFFGVGLGDWTLYVGLRSHLYTLQMGRSIGLFRPSFLLGWSPLLPWKLGAYPLRVEISAGAVMDFQVVDRGEQKYALVSGWGFALGARLRLELASWFTLSLDLSVHYLPPFGFSPTEGSTDAPHLVQMPVGLGAWFTF